MATILLGGCSHSPAAHRLQDHEVGTKSDHITASISLHPSVIVKWKHPEFLYTDTLLSDNDLLSYRVTPDGTLNPLFSPQEIDNLESEPNVPEAFMEIQGLMVGPHGKHLYGVISIFWKNVDGAVQFRVNKNGNLKTMRYFANNIDASSLAFAGNDVYVLSDDPQETHYVIRGYHFRNDGAIKPAQGLPLASGTLDRAHSGAIWTSLINTSLTVDTQDRLLYIVYSNGWYIKPYHIAPSGSLTALPSILLPDQPSSFFPNGRYVYVTSESDPNVTRYFIGHNGSLIHPLEISLGSPGTATAISKSGKFLYVCSVNRIISTFQVGANGNLRLLGISTIASVPFYLTVDQTGRFLYVLGNCDSGENCINQFHISGNGTLTPLQPAQVSAPESGMLITAQAIP